MFVESAKELPATLILRPFNYETLATHVYVHASLEQLEAAAPAALAVITVGAGSGGAVRFMLRPPPWTRHARMAKTHEAGDGKQSAPGNPARMTGRGCCCVRFRTDVGNSALPLTCGFIQQRHAVSLEPS